MAAAELTAQDAEARLRDALSDSDVAAPDVLTVDRGRLRATWREPHVVVEIVVDPGMPR